MVPLGPSCRFRFGADVATGIEQRAFDDAAWEAVTLPHTWNALDGTRPDMARGVGWYRLRFVPPAMARGRRGYVCFAGVAGVSSAWLNGVELGSHVGATTGFAFDITDALDRGGENILVVRADTTWRDDVPPREGDFTLFGGFYRAASLLFTSEIAIDPLDHASPGVYLTTPDVSAVRATVRARIRIRNACSDERRITIAVRACAAASPPSPNLAPVTGTASTARGAPDASSASIVTEHVAPPGVSETTVDFAIAHPRLWHGRRDPHLYVVIVELHDGSETVDGSSVVDRVDQPLGVRSTAIDAERGFLLNGEPYDLRGANLHQDCEGRGWAMLPADRERDFALLCEMGATFVRLVHYQHDQHAHELADRLGLVIWAEHALVNTVSESPLFAERAALQLTELIRQSYNHPSIVCWGIGNEVKTHALAAAPALLRRLAALARAEDPSRPSALATCFDEPAGAYGVDLVAHNQYFGWYRGTFDDFPAWLDAQRDKNPTMPMGMSEYGAGAGISLHSTTPRPLDHTEEHQALFHEAYWRVLRERPWVFCKAVWQMFDAASSSRNEGERPGVNDKGLVTRDRLVKKDAYYWYKASWTDDPFVYITSRRFTPRREATTEVKVYSTCHEVELWHNGRSLGPRPVRDRIARWPEVVLSAGSNRMQVVGRTATAEVSDACEWTFDAGIA